MCRCVFQGFPVSFWQVYDPPGFSCSDPCCDQKLQSSPAALAGDVSAGLPAFGLHGPLLQLSVGEEVRKHVNKLHSKTCFE